MKRYNKIYLAIRNDDLKSFIDNKNTIDIEDLRNLNFIINEIIQHESLNILRWFFENEPQIKLNLSDKLETAISNSCFKSFKIIADYFYSITGNNTVSSFYNYFRYKNKEKYLKYILKYDNIGSYIISIIHITRTYNRYDCFKVILDNYFDLNKDYFYKNDTHHILRQFYTKYKLQKLKNLKL